jgi:hypothetical protein
MDNKEAEGSPTTIFPDCYKFEYLVALDTKHNDQLSFGQIPIEISKRSSQLSYLQTQGYGNNHGKLDL